MKGTNTMKKTILYLPAAALLGILITIVPLITITQTSQGQNEAYPQLLGKGLKKLDGNYGANNTMTNDSTLTVLAISLVVALAVYTVVRRRIPRQFDIQFRMPP